jgi:antitoxin CcdA
MSHTTTRRRATNVTLPEDLLDEAKMFGINVSQASERGLADAVCAARAARWQQENAEALKQHDEWIAKNGLPLARYRMF